MKIIQKTISSAGYHLYYSLTSPKLWTAGLLIFASVYRLVFPYAKIAGDFNADVNIGFISCFFSNPFSVTIIFMALLFIFSELPFNNSQQIFLVSRSGKRSWCISQFLYIVLISLMAILVISLLTIIMLSGHLSFDNSWGKVINTVPQNYDLFSEKYRISGSLSYEAINIFTPYKALAWSIPIGTLTFAVFGNLIFALNMISRKTVGIAIGAIIITFHILISGKTVILWKFRWFSPLEWSNIGIININHNSQMPTPEYAVCVLLGLYILSIAAVLFRSGKKSDIL